MGILQALINFRNGELKHTDEAETETWRHCFSRSNASFSVILALVAGIQRPDVCRVKGLLSPKDLAAGFL